MHRRTLTLAALSRYRGVYTVEPQNSSPTIGLRQRGALCLLRRLAFADLLVRAALSKG